MRMDLLYLTTVGARTGQKRLTPVTRFADSDGAWLIVASAAGSAHNPSWYHNIAAHPDQIWIEVAGQHMRVEAEQLDGQRREEAWQRIVSIQPRYAGYQRKTDRVLPIIRLAPVAHPGPSPPSRAGDGHRGLGVRSLPKGSGSGASWCGSGQQPTSRARCFSKPKG